ncbi:MAG: hypothetical protein IT204_10505 [Fimbriimonadaceae bacterium]|nr:hypothetical protein [Fimbriimonadaceae bacterium]
MTTWREERDRLVVVAGEVLVAGCTPRRLDPAVLRARLLERGCCLGEAPAAAT